MPHRILPAIALLIAPLVAQAQPAPQGLSEVSRGTVKIPKSELGRVRFDGDLTVVQLPPSWGSGAVFSSGPERQSFSVDSGEELWLLFDRDTGKLLTATLRGEEGKPVTILYAGNYHARNRRWDQLPRKHKVCLSEVIAAWGPEDYGFGSGLDYRVWELANGRSVTLLVGSLNAAVGPGCEPRR